MNDLDPSLRLDDLPLADATRVRLLEETCKWISTNPKPSSSFERAAVEVSARLVGLDGPAARPVSEGTMRRMYYAWIHAEKSWRALLDRRTIAANKNRVRTAQPAFRAHLAMLAGRHKRALMGAIKELYKDWRDGKVIPGYEGMNYKPNMPLPSGWSVDNLMRCMPDKLALTMTRQGVRAASSMLPQVYSTRAGGWPLSRVMFDDVWLDCLAQGYDRAGQIQINRPLQLGCLDYFSGMRLSWFTKLRTMGTDGSSLQLNEDEMLFLLCDYLLNVGYSRRGTTLVCEHGTAAISREIEDMLAMLSGGCIKVDRSGITGLQQVGAFGGRGVGNPREKASLESWHNLLHNQMDGELTQVGKDRREPEALWGIRKNAEALAKAGQKLGQDAALYLSPFVPTLAELAEKLVQVVGAINNRTDHDLEGWKECGFSTLEFSMTGNGNWTRLDEMPQDMAAVARALATQNPALLRERKLSPMEAWTRCYNAADIVRFTPAECVTLVGTKFKFKLTPKGGGFHLNSTKRHHRQLIFETSVTTADGFTRELPFGPDYFGILNPLSETLFVLDSKDRVLGVATPTRRFSHTDEAARLQEFGRVQHRRAEELARVANIMAPDAAAMQTTLSYNQQVLDGKPADPLAKADDRRLRKLANKAETRQQEAALAYTPKPSSGLDLLEDYPDDTPFH